MFSSENSSRDVSVAMRPLFFAVEPAAVRAQTSDRSPTLVSAYLSSDLEKLTGKGHAGPATQACKLEPRVCKPWASMRASNQAGVFKVPSMTPLQQSPDPSNTALRNRSPLKFFLLVFALSIPFWLMGSVTGLQLLPGLPVAALMFVCPVTAAMILVYGENRTAGVIALLERSVDYKRIIPKVWYAPILLLMPAVMTLSYELMRLLGVPLPTPQIPFLATAAMFITFFIAALGEELGWSGYITDAMQDR